MLAGAMEIGPKESAWPITSWDAMVQASGDPAFSFYDYLCRSFPQLETSQRMMLEAAFQRVQKEEMVELNWNLPMDDIPPEWKADMTFHSTSPLRVPSIRECGLLPSAHGAKSKKPAVYTSPLRTTCMRSYCGEAVFPTLGKTFAVMFGIGGTKAFACVGDYPAFVRALRSCVSPSAVFLFRVWALMSASGGRRSIFAFPFLFFTTAHARPHV
jgi:hypothetical protein